MIRGSAVSLESISTWTNVFLMEMVGSCDSESESFVELVSASEILGLSSAFAGRVPAKLPASGFVSGVIIVAGLKMWIWRSLPIPKLREESPIFSAVFFTSFLSSAVSPAEKAYSVAVPDMNATI